MLLLLVEFGIVGQEINPSMLFRTTYSLWFFKSW